MMNNTIHHNTIPFIMPRSMTAVTTRQQSTTTLDTGAFMLNYVGCAECKSYDFPVQAERVVEEDEQSGEESVAFERSN